MKVYTSYYKRVSTQFYDMLPVRISTSYPSWFPREFEEIPELYPGWDLVNGIKSGNLSWEDYVVIYKDKLAQLNRREILQKLVQFSKKHGGKDVVLLCYESPDKPCHRHLVAEWLGSGVVEL